MPTARDPEKNLEVDVTVLFTEDERTVLAEFAEQVGWTAELELPEQIVFHGRSTPLGGSSVTTDTHPNTLSSFATNVGVLKRQPSLDLVFLPAERRLLPPTVAGVDLNQLSADVAISKLAESRNAIQNFGRLDDAEFETYATALCVQGSLKSEEA